MRISTEPSDHLLSDADNERIFRQTIWPIISDRGIRGQNPVAIFIGGQPASGKTLLLGKLSPAINAANAIKIIGDDLRSFHPSYDPLKRYAPLHLTACTGPDSARWIERGIT